MHRAEPMRAGSFELEAVIASGGFGTIYRGEGGVAVKVLHADLASSAEAIARFEREVDVLRRVKHPGLIEIIEVGQLPDGRPYYAMELLHGRDLDAHIAERGRLSPAACLAVLGPLCDALAAAHDAGIVHRDIKASNVFLADDGRVLLLDFGIAKLLDGDVGLTRSRQALGTPACMAPEQIAGRPATVRSDVYGLGALVYHMLTGAPAFADASSAVTVTVMQYLHAHARRPLATARANLPAAIDEVIGAAMALEPDRRHPGPRELLAACRAALGESDADAPGQIRPAMAVQVDVRVAGSDGDLSAALDDADAVWSAARAHFSTRGFVPALEASETLLFLRPLDEPGHLLSPPPPPPPASRDPIAEFQQVIEARAGRHPFVTVTIEVSLGEAAFSGSLPVVGSLSWTSAPSTQKE